MKDASKNIFSLALPMAGTQFISIASSFLCMTMLAALGHDVLAASALIYTTQVSIFVSGLAILLSLSILIGHAYGAKEYRSIGNYVQQGWTLSIIISIPIMLIFWNIDKILLLCGESKEITSIVHSYFHAYVWAVIPSMLCTCNMQFCYGVHKKNLIIATSILSVCVLLITAHTLIFGKFGFPKLGVAGLGYAVFVQFCFYFTFSTLFFYYEDSFKRFDLFHYRIHQELDHFKKMLTVGWPICVQIGGEMLSFFVSGVMIGWLGSVALAAYQIVNQYYFLVIVPIFALSQAGGILVGQACGSKEFQLINKLCKASILLALVMSGTVAIAFIACPSLLASLYLDINNPANAATLHLTIVIFIIIAISQMLDAVRNVLVGTLRGLLDTRYPMYISIITIWFIGMPISYLLAFPLHFGAAGFLMGGVLGMLGSVVILIYRWTKIAHRYS